MSFLLWKKKQGWQAASKVNIELSTAEPKARQLGLVSGNYVASRIFYLDFTAGIRNFFGWEIKE